MSVNIIEDYFRVEKVRPKIFLFQHTPTEGLVRFLEGEGFNVSVVERRNALSEIDRQEHDVYIVDTYRKTSFGDTSLIDYIRVADSKTPVMVLTDILDPNHAMRCFNAGADDYLRRPFHYGELAARINTRLRNVTLKDTNRHIIVGDYVIDTYERMIGYKFSPAVPIKENLLRFVTILASNRDNVVSIDYIQNKLHIRTATALSSLFKSARALFKKDRNIVLQRHRNVGISLSVIPFDKVIKKAPNE